MKKPEAPLRVAFRTDASIQIGTGHVMRCLTLADALREKGAECQFLCRPHEGNLLGLIAERGHTAVQLSPLSPDETCTESFPPHVHWLGTSWQRDAADTRAAIGAEHVDWLVVDHYALDAKWQNAVRSHFHKLLVIDDLADRPHSCDILLDQNLGRLAQDYTPMLAADTQTLIGPHYALLRPEFAQLRPESLGRRAKPRLERILVTMGGIDKGNATKHVLDALDGVALPANVEITVVMGANAPWLAQVRQRATQMQHPTRVLVEVSNMARLMTDSDLAIGAAGSTSWERCCLGLPTFQLVMAENQMEIGKALEGAGAVVSGTVELLDLDIKRVLEDGLSSGSLIRQAERARAICDGSGTIRVVKRMRQVLS